MVKYVNILKIKEKNFETKYKNEPIFISEKVSKLVLRIGKHKIGYYYKDRKKTSKIGEYPYVTLYEARKQALLIEGEINIPEEYKAKKTILEAIYGNPNLFSQNKYHSNEYIRENIGEGSYLAKYKNRTNTSAFIDKKNKMRLLARHYVDRDNSCTATIDKLNGLEIKQFAENYHIEEGKSALSSKRLFNEWKTFFKWLAINEGIPDVLAGIELSNDKVKVKRREYRDPSFKPHEIHSLINSYEQMKEPYKWLHPFMMFTGRRMASVLRLEKTDVDFDKNIINFRPDNEKMSMNNSDAVPPAYIEIPMCKSLEVLVKDHIIPYKSANKFLFPHPTIKDIALKPNDREMRDKVREITGITGFNYKDIRTNVNTALIGLGIDLRVRQLILGQKSEKVESRELQKPKALTVNEIFYDKNTYLEEKRDALDQLESIWISASQGINDVNTITNKDKIRHLPQKTQNLNLINNYLKSKNLDRKKCLKGDVRLDASDFMQKVQNFFHYQDYSEYEDAKRLFTNDVELYLYAFIFNELKEEPNYWGRDYLDNWKNLQVEVEKLPRSTWKRKYNQNRLKIVSQIAYYQNQYENWKENEESSWESSPHLTKEEDNKMKDIISHKYGLEQAIKRFNATYLDEGKDYSPDTLGHSKRQYLAYYNKLKDLEIAYFPYLFKYQIVKNISDEDLEKYMLKTMQYEFLKNQKLIN
jgi:integrase